MKNAMTVFEKEGFGKIRITMIEDQPWFVASDVADALEFSEASAMTRYLDDDEKGLSTEQTLGGAQNVLIINESGLYSAIMRSRKPEAKTFKKWVTSEILPSIRKTGGYRVDQINSPSSEFDMVCIGLKYTSEMLKLSNVSKLAMMSHAFDTYGLNSKALPQYVENVRPVFSATKLLSNRGKPFSASVFNAKMILAGFLEEKERTGSKGTVKTFKILTDKAVGHYGQNDVNPSNPLETQPHYFEDTFDKLLDII